MPSESRSDGRSFIPYAINLYHLGIHLGIIGIPPIHGKCLGIVDGFAMFFRYHVKIIEMVYTSDGPLSVFL